MDPSWKLEKILTDFCLIGQVSKYHGHGICNRKLVQCSEPCQLLPFTNQLTQTDVTRGGFHCAFGAAAIWSSALLKSSSPPFLPDTHSPLSRADSTEEGARERGADRPPPPRYGESGESSPAQDTGWPGIKFFRNSSKHLSKHCIDLICKCRIMEF